MTKADRKAIAIAEAVYWLTTFDVDYVEGINARFRARHDPDPTADRSPFLGRVVPEEPTPDRQVAARLTPNVCELARLSSFLNDEQINGLLDTLSHHSGRRRKI